MQTIPINKIFADEQFNCRGTFTPFDVLELSKNIRECGLIQPVTVRPASPDRKTKGYDYELIVGFRRHLACKMAEMTEIPAIVRDDLTPTQAVFINLSENLNRKDLNIIQEAKSVNKLYQMGIKIKDIAAHIDKSTTWVQVRLNILKLPVEIQSEAAKGVFNQHHLQQICTFKTPDEQFEAARKIKEKLQAGLSGHKIKITEDKPNAYRIKVRSPLDIQNLINYLLKTVKGGLHTRVLAWAAGNITNLDLHESIKEYAKMVGIPYEIPQDGDIPVHRVPLDPRLSKRQEDDEE